MPAPFPFKPLTLRGITLDSPLFAAPMANLSHSAWRRLVAHYGGCGGVFSEMLSARMVLTEDFGSPWLKRRPGDGRLFYQLLVTDTARLPEVVARMVEAGPDGLDLNAACAAPLIIGRGGGAALFEDALRLRDVLRIMRRGFPGPLTVKIRLGRDTPGWEERLQARLRLMEDEGVDAVILHPRFAEDKFKRHARHEWLGGIVASTRLPVIANGDITGPEFAEKQAAHFASVAGLMVGRQAAAQPWLFGCWRNPDLVPDPAEAAFLMCDYLAEDFIPDKALRRLKVWMPYFASNYKFGHTLAKAVQQSADWEQALARLRDFLAADPERLETVSICGL